VRDVVVTGLPEMTDDERLQAELSILGLDVSSHVVAGYLPLLTELQVTFSADLLARRKRRDVLIGGVKVATQTPPVRSGRRVIFLTLDDTTGPVDATFFEDVQGPYASTVFNSWMLVVRGQVRRTGPRGVSLLAQACWDLTELHSIYQRVFAETGDGEAALAAVTAFMDSSPDEAPELGVGEYSFSGPAEEAPLADPQQRTRGGGMGRRRVLVHGTGYEQSPYADVLPAGTGAAQAPRKLWHSSQGSAGR
jgi:error-prone DNA polymerase